MTKDEAKKIIILLISGKEYKSGHYHYGYFYFFFRDGFIIKKREDISVNIFELCITEEKICQEEFEEFLMKEEEYEDFIKNII